MRRSSSILVLLVVLSASAASAQTVPGKSQAKALFDEGVALEKSGDFPQACARFDEAAKILATPGVRYHQGYAYEMRGMTATALDHYESALALAREQKKADVERATLARLEPLRGRVPQLAVRLVTRVDARVRLDDKDVAQPLLEGRAFRVDPGEHTLTATAAGYRDFSRKITARESTASSVDVVLERSTTAATARAAAPHDAGAIEAPASAHDSPAPLTEPPKEPRGRSTTTPLVLTGAALALAAGGVVSFVLAGGAQSDARSACAVQVSCDDERTKVRTLDAIALGGFVGAATLGAVSIVLWTSPRPSGRGPATRVVAGPTGAAFSGVFE